MAEVAEKGAAAPKPLCVQCNKRLRASKCDYRCCKACCNERYNDCKAHNTAGSGGGGGGGAPPPPSFASRSAAPGSVSLGNLGRTPRPVPADRAQHYVPMVDAKETFTSYKRDLFETHLWRKHSMQKLDEEDLIAQDEALKRYQVNVQLLEELFDGKTIEDLSREERFRSSSAGLLEKVEQQWKASSRNDSALSTHTVQQKLERLHKLREMAAKVRQSGSHDELRTTVEEFATLVGPDGPQGLLQNFPESNWTEGSGIEMGLQAQNADQARESEGGDGAVVDERMDAAEGEQEAGEESGSEGKRAVGESVSAEVAAGSGEKGDGEKDKERDGEEKNGAGASEEEAKETELGKRARNIGGSNGGESLPTSLPEHDRGGEERGASVKAVRVLRKVTLGPDDKAPTHYYAIKL